MRPSWTDHAVSRSAHIEICVNGRGSGEGSVHGQAVARMHISANDRGRVTDEEHACRHLSTLSALYTIKVPQIQRYSMTRQDSAATTDSPDGQMGESAPQNPSPSSIGRRLPTPTYTSHTPTFRPLSPVPSLAHTAPPVPPPSKSLPARLAPQRTHSELANFVSSRAPGAVRLRGALLLALSAAEGTWV